MKEEKKTIEEEVIISKSKDDTGTDEWYCRWFRCPNCKKNWIYVQSNYCPNCGVKLKWVK